MLHGIKELRGFAVEASDGPIGRVRDFLFDDEQWAVRFFVVHAGDWLDGRNVLISPISIGNPDWRAQRLPVFLTREQVRNSPDIDTTKPVSRQHEIEQFSYYGYPFYWGGPGVWGEGMLAAALRPAAGAADQQAFVEAQRQAQRERGDDPHLRGCDAIMRYHVHAVDGDIGHVDGLVVDDESWVIRYLVVNTSNWWLGRDVLIATRWIDGISWLEGTVSVSISRQAVKSAPLYDPAAPPDRKHERQLHDHHGRKGYWVEGEASDPQAPGA